MPYFAIPRRWNRRPSGNVGLNGNHYRTSLLSISFLANRTTKPSNSFAKGNKSPVIAGSSTSLVTAPVPGYGLAPDFAATYQYNITGPKLLAATTTPLTVSWAEYWLTSASTYQGICSISTGSGGNSMQILRSPYPAGSGYAPLTVAQSAAGVSWDVAGAIGITCAVGDFHRFVVVGTAGCGSTTNTDWTMYCDGVAYTPKATTVGMPTATTNTFGWDGSQTRFPGQLFDYLVAERAWGADEVAEYFADPYGHYAPIMNRVYFDQAAVGGSTKSRYYYDMTTGAD